MGRKPAGGGFCVTCTNYLAVNITKRLNAAVVAVFILCLFSGHEEHMNSARFVKLQLNGQQASEAIVEDLISRPEPIRAAVITRRPYILLSVVRKRWLKKLRKMRIERARLLGSLQTNQLSQRIATLEKLQFALLSRHHDADISFSTVHELSQLLYIYELIYVSSDVPVEAVQMALNDAPPGRLVIVYE